MQRLKGKLLDCGYGKEVVEAVLGARDPLANISDVMVRMNTVKHMVSAPGAGDLMRVGIRIGNILKPESPDIVQADALSGASEKALWKLPENVKANWSAAAMQIRSLCQAQKLNINHCLIYCAISHRTLIVSLKTP
jgi:glycyl-tRNA synthetase beta subunit